MVRISLNLFCYSTVFFTVFYLFGDSNDNSMTKNLFFIENKKKIGNFFGVVIILILG